MTTEQKPLAAGEAVDVTLTGTVVAIDKHGQPLVRYKGPDGCFRHISTESHHVIRRPTDPVVVQLRPMSEAPRDGTRVRLVTLERDYRGAWEANWVSEDDDWGDWVVEGEESVTFDDYAFLGWAPDIKFLPPAIRRAE